MPSVWEVNTCLGSHRPVGQYATVSAAIAAAQLRIPDPARRRRFFGVRVMDNGTCHWERWGTAG